MRGSHDRRRPAAKLVAGLVPAILVLVAAASYAAVRPGVGNGPERHAAPAMPIKAPATIPVAAAGAAGLRIAEHPPELSTRRTALFRTVAAGEPDLRCRLDRQPARPCEATVVYRGLGEGTHTFLVAARRGQHTVRADFGWQVLEPESFEVEPRPASVGPLYPGAAPLPIRVVISNPNDVPIVLTELRVSADGGAAGCDPAANVALTTPNLSEVQPRIPANGTLTLPSPDIAAPTIALRELGVDQDACQGASFNLSFSGSAGA